MRFQWVLPTGGYPHPGCFGKRGWICLKTQELTFLGATKRPEQIGDKGDKLEETRKSWRPVLLVAVFEDFTTHDSIDYLLCK